MVNEKRTYKDFPREYFDIVEWFGQNPSEVFSTRMLMSEARRSRRDFYRFRRALDTEVASDAFAKQLSDIARDIVITTEPATAANDDFVALNFSLNPLSRAIREKFSQEKG